MHYNLAEDFKLNVEANHATLAGHSFAHELQMCSDAGLLGSIDANRGDPQLLFPADEEFTPVRALALLASAGTFQLRPVQRNQ